MPDTKHSLILIYYCCTNEWYLQVYMKIWVQGTIVTSVTASPHVADACSCSLPALITLHRQALAMDPDSPRLPPELERLIFELAVQLHRPLAATLARVYTSRYMVLTSKKG